MTVKRDMNAISPLDGRYSGKIGVLAGYAGEGALIRHRVLVECRYLGKLCGTPGINILNLNSKEKKLLEKLALLSKSDVLRIAAIEDTGVPGLPATKHDVKAVEYFIKRKLSRTRLRNISEFVHFALTSEDVNNIAYALMLRDCMSNAVIPALEEILKALDLLARNYASSPLLARTHGQPAVPTTFGKEFRVFHARLLRQVKQIKAGRICAKLNGASGNYNAHVVAFPSVNWKKFSEEFVESFNSGIGLRLEHNSLTTQIEPHDSYAELFDALRRTNTILLAFCQDMWRYISAGLLTQKAVAGEIGSSTMPQKVNPIHFENAEGNLGLANAMLTFFSSKLPVSRLQRDLSDSTVERNFGVAFGHSVVAYKSLIAGLMRVSVNEKAARAELELHPEVVAEGIQTILRREREAGAYELLCRFTRGRTISVSELENFIDGLKLKPEVKAELKRITPLNYTGLAAKLAKGR